MSNSIQKTKYFGILLMYWDNWPVAHPAYLFGAKYFKRNDLFLLWKENKHFLKIEELKRNVPVRNPLIWTELL
jgi:hypothetical protein